MMNLADWRKNLQSLLGVFIMEVQAFVRELTNTHQADAERKLEEYGRELANGSNQLSEAKTAYKEAVESYLSKFPPTFSDDFVNNLKEYDKLIIFALRSSDKNLLFKWGIQQPQSQHFKWINDSDERKKYVIALQNLSNDAPGAKEYYDELIKHIEMYS
jgi:hypothetical protein